MKPSTFSARPILPPTGTRRKKFRASETRSCGKSNSTRFLPCSAEPAYSGWPLRAARKKRSVPIAAFRPLAGSARAQRILRGCPHGATLCGALRFRRCLGWGIRLERRRGTLLDGAGPPEIGAGPAYALRWSQVRPARSCRRQPPRLKTCAGTNTSRPWDIGGTSANTAVPSSMPARESLMMSITASNTASRFTPPKIWISSPRTNGRRKRSRPGPTRRSRFWRTWVGLCRMDATARSSESNHWRRNSAAWPG